jgi:ABC-type glycerol-3-phosphate transport system permease component
MGAALKHAVLLLASLVALAPAAFMVLTAFKPQEEYAFDKTGLPDVWVLDHLRAVLFDNPFLQWMLNSAILAAGAVGLSLLVSAPAAFAIARMQFPAASSAPSPAPS